MLLDKLLSNLTVHVEPFALCTMTAGWRLHLPGPPGLLFHFVLAGDGVLFGPGGDAHPIAPLHLAVVPIGAKHVLQSAGEVRHELRIDALPDDEPICRIVAGSSEEIDLVVGCGIVSVRYGPSLNLFDHLQDVLAVDFSDLPDAEATFHGIMEEQRKSTVGSTAMTSALMTQCLIHLFRRLPWESERSLPWLTALQDERLGRVVDKVLDEPGDHYSVESLAETAAMSRSAFAEQFTAAFGRSPMSFVNHVRMQHAAHLLTVGNMSIDQVTKAVGYSSRSHFSRAFAEHSGLPPKAFRSEHPAH
jgi:AraC-like DNA-binding protein